MPRRVRALHANRLERHQRSGMRSGPRPRPRGLGLQLRSARQLGRQATLLNCRHARTIAHMSNRAAAAFTCVVLGIVQAQTTRLRTSGNLAQLDAKVTDSKGNPGPGLTADDVELQVDGKAQKITHCDYIPGVAPKASDPDRK